MLQPTFCIILLGVTGTLANEECAATSLDCPNSSGERTHSSHLLHDTESQTSPCYSPCIQQGMYCREENDEIRCTKAKNCDQLTCNKGKVCSETAEGPTCVNNVFPSCMDVTCPNGMRCVELRIPSRDLCVGQCFGPEITDTFPTYEQYTCSSRLDVCSKQGTVCIESFQDGNFLTVVCAPTGCSDESQCPGFLLCAETPPHLQDSFKSVCVAPTNFEFGNDSCNTFDKGCTNGFVCHDFTFEGQHIGTDCGPSGTAFTAPSCSKLECPAMLECYQRIIDGRGGLGQCAFKQSVDVVAEEIKSLLNLLPLE